MGPLQRGSSGVSGESKTNDRPLARRYVVSLVEPLRERVGSKGENIARPLLRPQAEASVLVVCVSGKRTECGVNLLLSSRRSEPIRLSEPALSKRSASNGVAQGRPRRPSAKGVNEFAKLGKANSRVKATPHGKHFQHNGPKGPRGKRNSGFKHHPTAKTCSPQRTQWTQRKDFSWGNQHQRSTPCVVG